MTRNGRTVLGFALLVLVLVADQASKWWVLHGLHLQEVRSIEVLPFLNFTMVWNQGVTFGLFHQEGAAGPWILAGVAVAASDPRVLRAGELHEPGAQAGTRLAELKEKKPTRAVRLFTGMRMMMLRV